MKIMFDKLKRNIKIFLIVMNFIISLGLVITSFIIDDDIVRIVLSTIALVILVVLFLMLIWFYSYQNKFKKDNHYDDAEPVDVIVEYPKVFDNHFLRYVFVEKLTLAENLDKVNSDSKEFIYVDEVDNKYDNEALVLFYKKYKLGYFYKNGKFRDLLRKCKEDKDFKIITRICKLDLNNNEIKLKIAFYKSLESENFHSEEIIFENKFNYIKKDYWLDIVVEENIIGKKIYHINDIYGKELATFENKNLDTYNCQLFGKVIEVDENIRLLIYAINK